MNEQERVGRLAAVVRGKFSALDVKEGRLAQLSEDLDGIRIEVKGLEGRRERDRQAVILLETVAAAGRGSVVSAFQDVVGRAMQAVLGPEYGVRVLHTVKRSSSQVVFAVGDRDVEPQDSRGGGVVDVMAFALRVVVLELLRPKLQGPLVLDEPFKHLSGDKVRMVCEVLSDLSDRFRRQFLIVTHQPNLAELSCNVIKTGG